VGGSIFERFEHKEQCLKKTKKSERLKLKASKEFIKTYIRAI